MKNKNTQGRLLFLLRYLQQNTDDQHPVTTPDLLAALESSGYPVDWRTLYDDINVLETDFDIDIITEKHRGNEYFVGEVYTNSPYDCLWNDDKYYLIGYSEKHQGLVTFRIDRIVNLEILMAIKLLKELKTEKGRKISIEHIRLVGLME